MPQHKRALPIRSFIEKEYIMQTVITITEKDSFKRADIARRIRHAAERLSERLEDGPNGTFRFTDHGRAGDGNRPVTVSHSHFQKIPGIKIEDV
ncbi:MAG: hypothetical protein Q8N16_02065 [bacterium]|nr:hypothetical protein [bacterium]